IEYQGGLSELFSLFVLLITSPNDVTASKFRISAWSVSQVQSGGTMMCFRWTLPDVLFVGDGIHQGRFKT
ncbi:MAG: hypothetical protein L7W43_16115, partial [Rubripirellula sp.]|nr:hypothetical protein [Rubripirellula sp.]